MKKKNVMTFKIVVLRQNRYIPQTVFTTSVSQPGTVEIYIPFQEYWIRVNLFDEAGIPISLLKAVAFSNTVIVNQLTIINPELPLETQFEIKSAESEKKAANFFKRNIEKGQITFLKDGKTLEKGSIIIANVNVITYESIMNINRRLEQQREFYENQIKHLQDLNTQISQQYQQQIAQVAEPYKVQLKYLSEELKKVTAELHSKEMNIINEESSLLFRAIDGLPKNGNGSHNKYKTLNTEK